MTFESLALPALILVTLTSIMLLLIVDWRVNLVAQAMEYLGVFILIALSWPLAMAVSQLVAGWMAGAVLGIAIASLKELQGSGARAPNLDAGRRPRIIPRLRIRAETIFQLCAAALVFLVIASLVPRLAGFFGGTRIELVWGCLILAGMAILKLGFSARPFPLVIGLLTFLSGFTILYAAVEISSLVAGLLAGVELSLALVGAYLVTAPQMEAEK